MGPLLLIREGEEWGRYCSGPLLLSATSLLLSASDRREAQGKWNYGRTGLHHSFRVVQAPHIIVRHIIHIIPLDIVRHIIIPPYIYPYLYHSYHSSRVI